MKTVGVILIVLSAASVGLRFSYAVRQRCNLLGQLILALRLLKSELSGHGTPIPEAFGFLAAATKGSAAAYFEDAAKQMNRKRWLTPDISLRAAECHLKELQNDDPVRLILREMSSGLGKLDLDSQLRDIDCAMARLEQQRQTAEQDRTVRCRTYRALGLCAGLALAILLV